MNLYTCLLCGKFVETNLPTSALLAGVALKSLKAAEHVIMTNKMVTWIYVRWLAGPVTAQEKKNIFLPLKEPSCLIGSNGAIELLLLAGWEGENSREKVKMYLSETK